MGTIREELGVIKESVIRSEEHLRGINGRLETGDKRMNGFRKDTDDLRVAVTAIQVNCKWHKWIMRFIIGQTALILLGIIGFLFKEFVLPKIMGK